MKGFNPEFVNIKDLIFKISDRIREEREIDRIRDYYSENVPVKTPSSITYHVEDVVRFILQTLQMFPDSELLGEEDEPGTFYSSHGILSTMTHQKDGFFPPTNEKNKNKHHCRLHPSVEELPRQTKTR